MRGWPGSSRCVSALVRGTAVVVRDEERATRATSEPGSLRAGRAGRVRGFPTLVVLDQEEHPYIDIISSRGRSLVRRGVYVRLSPPNRGGRAAPSSHKEARGVFATSKSSLKERSTCRPRQPPFLRPHGGRRPRPMPGRGSDRGRDAFPARAAQARRVSVLWPSRRPPSGRPRHRIRRAGPISPIRGGNGGAVLTRWSCSKRDRRLALWRRAAGLSGGSALARRVLRARRPGSSDPSSRSPSSSSPSPSSWPSCSLAASSRRSGLLSRATRRIAEGDYRAEVRGPGSARGGRSESSSKASTAWPGSSPSDKLELERYIAEIVGLKERADGIIESIREGLAVIDAEGRVESANASFRGLFGEARGVEGRADRRYRARALRRGHRRGTARGPCTTRRTGRRMAPARAARGRRPDLRDQALSPRRAEPARGGSCIVIVEDASERLAYEERVIQADKLASIGMLSAGVAHEINNPLSSILANLGQRDQRGARSRGRRLPQGRRGRDARIARIVGSCSISRPQSGARRTVGRTRRRDATRTQSRGSSSSSSAILSGATAAIEFRELLDPDCPEVAMAEDELKQVLLNLLKNALQAVGREG